ncbi:hypothetical protein [Flavobacterium silvaticum]|uniref:Uncharacterized protein n=1 Tax=Flavobacterium silvaticum TaxID=1852020 RepID=A0A972JGC7_9FLAO|nr:hypothetical protein [Flavobacterium silvaticum]NMH26715.1 hypothetical protein [Flavobacterium silvaticum]
MKKIIAMAAIALACSLSATAQEAKKSTTQTEVAAAQKFLGLDKQKSDILTQLMDYKHKIKEDPKSSDKVKQELPWMLEKKMEGFLSKEEMTKLKGNKELFLQITQ